jgi:hypothetical protein
MVKRTNEPVVMLPPTLPVGGNPTLLERIELRRKTMERDGFTPIDKRKERHDAGADKKDG